MAHPPHHTRHAPSVTQEVGRALRRRFWSQVRWFHRLGRWQRWMVRVSLAMPLIVIIAIVVATRTPVTRWVLIPALESALNMDIDAASVYVRSDGIVVVNRAVFHIPGVPGAAGEVLRVDRIEAEVSWSRTLTGSPTIKRILLDGPLVRVSQSVDDGKINLYAFRHSIPQAPTGPTSAPPQKALRLPTIEAINAAIELGEHAGSRYSVLRRLPVRGVLAPSPEGPEAGYIVSLNETPTIPRPGHKPIKLTGTLKRDDFNIVIDRVGLDVWPAQAVPSPSRKLYEDLNLQGTVDRIVLGYTRTEGLSAEMALTNVAMNLPMIPRTSDAEDKPPRMEGVSGTITFKRDSVDARLKGVLEDLPYEVALTYHGVSDDAAFRVELISRDFRVEKYPKLLPYATSAVRKRLQNFSGPTAVIDTRVVLTRGRPLAPNQPAEIEYQAWMDVREAAGAFDKFPYPFQNVSAHVYVDNTKIEFTDITGVSPSGATLRAHGIVQPPTDDQQVDIFVEVRGAPVDKYLEQAFGPKRQDVLDSIVSKAHYQELLHLGLIRAPGDKERLEGELAQARAEGAGPGRISDLERRLAAPLFEFGGLIDIDLHVHRPPGTGVQWATTVDVRIARGGLIPREFPLPVHARDVVVRITQDSGEVISGVFEGLRGGTGSVRAKFMIPQPKAPETPNRPEIDIVARGVPLDDLLIQAIPQEQPNAGETGKPLRQILTDLGLSGRGDAWVRIAPRDLLQREGVIPSLRDDTGFTARVKILAGESSPFGEGAVLKDITGDLHVTEESLRLVAAGRGSGGGRVDLNVTSRFKAPGGAAVDTTVVAEELDASVPVERIVRVFSEPAAAQLAALRELYKPSGRAASETKVVVRGGAARSVVVDLRSLRDISFDFFGGRVVLGETTGSVRVKALEGPLIEYDALHAPLTFNGKDSGVVTLTGARRYGLPAGHTGPSMHVAVERGRFESPILPAILGPGIGVERLAAYSAMDPEGEFDAEIAIAGVEPLTAAAFSGSLTPRSFALDLGGERVALSSFTGKATFDGPAGRFEHLEGASDHWQLGADGPWTSAGGGLDLDLDLTASGAALTPDAAAVLPATLRTVLAGILFRLDGPYDLREAHLRWLVGAGLERDHATFHGLVDFRDVSLEAGVPVSGMSGRLEADFRQPPGGAAPTYGVAVVADRLYLSKAPAENARAVVQNGQVPGETLVPLLTGECLGGRFSGNLRVTPIAGTVAREYSGEFQVAGVEFGPLQRSFVPVPPTPDPIPEPQRGRLDANFAIGGVVNEPLTRRGRGSMRVAGQGVSVLDMPFVLKLIEVSNLQLPSGSDLDYAQAMFYVDGPRIVFDDLSVYSRAVEVLGFGTMTWPEMEMNLRFDSSSARPVPVVSWVLEGIRDQLVTTRVTGTPEAPVIRVEAMPTTREAFARALGIRSAAARELEDMERRAAENRRTIRPTGGVIQASPARSDAGSGREGP